MLTVGPLALDLRVPDELAPAMAALLQGYDAGTADTPRYRIELEVTLAGDHPRGLPREPRFVAEGARSVDHSELWRAALTPTPAGMHASFVLRDGADLDAATRARWQALWLAAVVRATLAQAAPHADALLLHAAALIAPDGTGHVFAGPSAEGKTSMTARLPWRVLADDAVLVYRVAPSHWRVAGTPLHGRERLPRRAESAPLGRLAFLEKNAPVLALTRLDAPAAFAALLPRILYYAPADAQVLALADALAHTGAAHRLASSLAHDLAPALSGPAAC